MRSSDTPRLPAAMLNNKPDESLPGTSFTNGPTVRATSRRWLDSIRITWAPKSAITRAGIGPAIDHVRSSTFNPSSARSRMAVPPTVVEAASAWLRQHRIGVLTEARRATEVNEVHAARLDERAWCDDRPVGEDGIIDLVPEVARSQLLAVDDVLGEATGAMSSIRERAASSSSDFVCRGAELLDDPLQPLVLRRAAPRRL